MSGNRELGAGTGRKVIRNKNSHKGLIYERIERGKGKVKGLKGTEPFRFDFQM